MLLSAVLLYVDETISCLFLRFLEYYQCNCGQANSIEKNNIFLWAIIKNSYEIGDRNLKKLMENDK